MKWNFALSLIGTVEVGARFVKSGHEGCGGVSTSGLCLPSVTIPQFSTIPTPVSKWSTPILPKPVLHTHGLIQVELPRQQQALIAPSYIAATEKFAVASPKRGKVVDQTEPTYFCKKPGFVLEGVDCVQTSIEDAKYICPTGFENLEGDCLRKSAFLQTCPLGYTKKDSNCAKIVTADFVPRCPDGTIEVSSGECHKQVQQPLIPTCPEGDYDSRTGTCIVKAYEEARAFCPEGFSLADGVCIQEEIYDCTKSQVGIESIPQLGVLKSTIVPQHSYHKGRILTHLKTHAQPLFGHVEQKGFIHKTTVIQPSLPVVPLVAPVIQQPCLARPVIAERVQQPCESQPVVKTQPTTTTITVQKTCTRVTSTALVFACDEGILQGTKCLVKQSAAPTPICRATGNVDYCYSVVRVAPLQECPPDYTKECLPGRRCQCVALEAAGFATSCPTGFDTIGDGCERRVQIKAVCDTPGFVLQGDACVRVLREPADCVFSVTYECDKSLGQSCA